MLTALVFVPALSALALTQAPNTSQTSALPVVQVTATLTVEDAEQFAPTFWRFRISAGGTSLGTVIQAPSVTCEVMKDDGSWGELGGAPGRFGAQSPLSQTGAADGPMAPRWRLPAGQTAGFAAELCDWRVTGFLGTYRLRAIWGVEGDVTPRETYAQFSILPAGAAGTALAQSRAIDGPLWLAYKNFMSIPFGVSPSAGGSGPESMAAKSFFDSLVADSNQPTNVLGETSLLPQRLRYRLDLAQKMTSCSSAFLMPQGQARDLAIGQAIGLWQSSGAQPGWWGAVARLQSLILTKTHQPGQYQSLLISLSQDEFVLDVARSQLGAEEASGLVLGERAPSPNPHGRRVRPETADAK